MNHSQQSDAPHHPMATRATVTALLAAALGHAALAAPMAGSPPAHVENLALGKPYTLHPAPSYQHCTDPDDRTQLTDGRTTTGYFWTQTGTVGWVHVPYATITVDLGRVEPISGVSMTTAAGTAGVTWPSAVHILVSDDGRTFRDAGDLVTLDHKEHGPWPGGYAIRRLKTHQLRTRGRYVQFVVIPLPGAPYLFTDEVAVFRGPEGMLDAEAPGPVTTADAVYREGRLRRAIDRRFHDDLRHLGEAIRTAGPEEVRARRFAARLRQVQQARQTEPVPTPKDFRAVLPLTAAHAELFAVQADLWRSLGLPPLAASVPPAWDPLDPFATPPKQRQGVVQLHTMRGEYRAAAVNLYNSSDRTAAVRLRFRGLPGSPQPPYVTVHEVAWTDTSRGVPVAAALPEAPSQDGAWTVSVLPGLVRQVWLTIHVTNLQPGEYGGSLLIQGPAGELLEIPVRFRLWPFDFPPQTTLLLGGWSYSNGSGAYGITPDNRQALLAHLQSHYVNAPWATSAVMKSFRFVDGDPDRIQLDTRQFDDWIDQWPDARRYMVFLSVAHYGGTIRSSFGGAEIGSGEFDRRVATWISAWVRHLRSRGIPPHRLGLLIHDEPHEGSQIGPFLAWARAIRAAEPDVLIWEDPTYRDPAKAPQELFELCDVLCPNRPMWLDRGEPFARFYRRQREEGRELQFYSCSGPARLLDPYSYYRLQAWHAWHVAATGSFFWAFGDNSRASSWNEYFATAGPYTPLFLDDHSVTPGKQMEAIRESVQDYEYLVMLQAAVERARAAARNAQAVAEAEKLLQTAATEVLEAPGASELSWHAPKDRTVADRVRVRILQALERLR